MDDLGLWHITVRQDETVGFDQTIQLATGLYIDKRALPVGTCSYLAHSTPDTAVFSFHEEDKPSGDPDTAVLSVTRLSPDNPEDYNLWKSRVSSYLLNKSGLGARRAWTCDCRSVRYEDDHYGESLVGLCACRIPAGFRLLPLTQYLACGLANPLQTFTASYVWNKSWRWGTVEDRFMNGSKIRTALKNMIPEVPYRVYAGGFAVCVPLASKFYEVHTVLLPIPVATAYVEMRNSEEWVTDAMRSLWSDVVFGIQTATNTTAYRPSRLSLMTKLATFAAGSALGYFSGTLLSSWILSAAATAAGALKFGGGDADAPKSEEERRAQEWLDTHPPLCQQLSSTPQLAEDLALTCVMPRHTEIKDDVTVI